MPVDTEWPEMHWISRDIQQMDKIVSSASMPRVIKRCSDHSDQKHKRNHHTLKMTAVVSKRDAAVTINDFILDRTVDIKCCFDSLQGMMTLSAVGPEAFGVVGRRQEESTS